MRLRRRGNGEVLREHLALDRLSVLDIGCGNGALARSMTRNGARVTGIECSAAQLHAARAVEAAGEERYVRAVAERLPFADAGFDAAVFFNSLHHVPGAARDTAHAGAARVLRAGATLCVCEPLAEGTGCELHRLIDDDTAVRAAASEARQRCPPRDLIPLVEQRYLTRYTHPDFAQFRDEVLRIDPDRDAGFETHAEELARRFRELGIPDQPGRAFEQPMRVNVFRRC